MRFEQIRPIARLAFIVQPKREDCPSRVHQRLIAGITGRSVLVMHFRTQIKAKTQMVFAVTLLHKFRPQRLFAGKIGLMFDHDTDHHSGESSDAVPDEALPWNAFLQARVAAIMWLSS